MKEKISYAYYLVTQLLSLIFFFPEIVLKLKKKKKKFLFEWENQRGKQKRD